VQNGKWSFTLKSFNQVCCFTAATNVVWSLELTAFSIMFLEGYMAAPPTTVFFEQRYSNTNANNANDKIFSFHKSIYFSYIKAFTLRK
jgi:hypothetical protein